MEIGHLCQKASGTWIQFFTKGRALPLSLQLYSRGYPTVTGLWRGRSAGFWLRSTVSAGLLRQQQRSPWSRAALICQQWNCTRGHTGDKHCTVMFLPSRPSSLPYQRGLHHTAFRSCTHAWCFKILPTARKMWGQHFKVCPSPWICCSSK